MCIVHVKLKKCTLLQGAPCINRHTEVMPIFIINCYSLLVPHTAPIRHGVHAWNSVWLMYFDFINDRNLQYFQC
jgi:hypothetical protein